jgi:2-iminobutanoate/2-iminopropanoate deaminase
MLKEEIKSKKLPASKGAYSKAIKVGDFVFTAGMGASEPQTDIFVQTIKTLEKLDIVLKEAGTSLRNAVKITAYIHDIKERDRFNEAYLKFFHNFNECYPVRTTIEVGHFPEGQYVEIDAIAVIP